MGEGGNACFGSSRAGPTCRERLLSPRVKPLEKLGALSGHQRLMRQYGVTPLMYQCGETVTVKYERRWHVSPIKNPLTPSNRRRESGP